MIFLLTISDNCYQQTGGPTKGTLLMIIEKLSFKKVD